MRTHLSSTHLRCAAILGMATALVLSMPLESKAHASATENILQGRDLDGNPSNGYEAYYDPALDITWLANAYLAPPHARPPQGEGAALPITYVEAKLWVESLTVHGVSHWHLPNARPVNGVSFDLDFSTDGHTDVGFNVTSPQSQMAHLYHVTLNGKGLFNLDGTLANDHGLGTPGPFENIQDTYWVEPVNGTASDQIVTFSMNSGAQQVRTMDQSTAFAWAVHSGDVLAVPEPAAISLAVVGLLVTFAGARRDAPVRRVRTCPEANAV